MHRRSRLGVHGTCRRGKRYECRSCHPPIRLHVAEESRVEDLRAEAVAAAALPQHVIREEVVEQRLVPVLIGEQVDQTIANVPKETLHRLACGRKPQAGADARVHRPGEPQKVLGRPRHRNQGVLIVMGQAACVRCPCLLQLEPAKGAEAELGIEGRRQQSRGAPGRPKCTRPFYVRNKYRPSRCSQVGVGQALEVERLGLPELQGPARYRHVGVEEQHADIEAHLHRMRERDQNKPGTGGLEAPRSPAVLRKSTCYERSH